MKNPLLIVFSFVLVFSSCSKELDDIAVPFNDNPYDNDYTGPKVIKIDNISTNTTGITRNEFYYTITHPQNEGVRLFKNGVLINTHYNHTAHTVFISDNSTSLGSTATYYLQIWSGGGTANSEPVTYTTHL